MTKWFDIDGRELSEEQALNLNIQQDFFVVWDEEDIPNAQCFKTAENWWAVRAKVGGQFYRRGEIHFDGECFYPQDGIHSGEEYFTTAALALVRN